MNRHKLIREFIPEVVKKLHMSMEFRQCLVVSISLCFTASWLGGLSRGKTQDQIAAMLSGTRDLDIEGYKTWKDKHRELFNKQYPFIQKVNDSYRLSMDTLMKVSPNVPPTTKYRVGPSTADDTGDAAWKSPPHIQMTKTATGTSFGTTT
ncbi:hypothetical protein Tco_1160710 [Tanacetum coccineum]